MIYRVERTVGVNEWMRAQEIVDLRTCRFEKRVKHEKVTIGAVTDIID
jgi:hypothetical protein